MTEFRWKLDGLYHSHSVPLNNPVWPAGHAMYGETIAVRNDPVLQYKIPASMVNHKYTREKWVDVPEVHT